MSCRNFSITVAGVFALAFEVLAGGSISFPGNYGLPAGYPMGPFGSVEPIHVESGDTVTVGVNFYDVDLSNIEYNVNVPLDTSLLPWWSTVYDYTVPGGTYIGGTFEVIPKINGVEVDRKSGTIFDPE